MDEKKPEEEKKGTERLPEHSFEKGEKRSRLELVHRERFPNNHRRDWITNPKSRYNTKKKKSLSVKLKENLPTIVYLIAALPLLYGILAGENLTLYIAIFLLAQVVYLIIFFLKKFWFGLSLSLFFIASLIAYQVIWFAQEPPQDSAVTLFFNISSDSSDWPIHSCNYNCWNNLHYSRCDFVSLNDFSLNNVDLSEEFLDGPIKNYSILNINCTPRNGLFEEGDDIICQFNSNKVLLPYDINAENCLMNRSEGNVTHTVHRFFRTQLTPRYCINYAGRDCTDWKDVQVVNGSFPIKIVTTGLQNIALALDWCYSYEESNGNYNSNDFGKNCESKQGIVYKSNAAIHIRSSEEVLEYSKNKRDRGYQFVLALFALFSVSSAVYNLKKLWREN
jgi:hypothetical protein